MIGLYQVDGKYPNLALMHLGGYLRGSGEQVARIGALEQTMCETVYASKVFTPATLGARETPKAGSSGCGSRAGR